jgi:hypothetical protein
VKKYLHLSLLAGFALSFETDAMGREIELIDPAALGFGSPAFTLDATYQGSLDYDNRSGGVESFESRAQLPVTKWEVGSVIFGATLGLTWRHVDFGPGFGLGEKDLFNIEAQITAYWRPKDSRWWGLGFVTPGLGTDFEAVNSDSFQIAALALLGYQVNPRFDLAAGVFAGYSLEDAQVLPAVGFIWRPDDTWIVQFTPPIVAIGWQPSPDWSLAVVTYPGGDSWEVAETEDGVRQVDLDLWRAALSIERRFGEHWRVSVRGGVAFGGELELRDSDARVLSSSDLDPAPFGAVAVKWAF